MQYLFDYRTFLQKQSQYPGIYQMFDDNQKVLYVGKAKNLKKRLGSYFRPDGLSIKNKSLMSKVFEIQTIITNSETEALILENNLIKQHRPKYNILLRDDKTYPYIHLTHQEYSRFKFHRGSRRLKGQYFGPFPNAAAVKETLDIIQKVFQIRNCDDSFFKHRTRPCLQHQINRCTAPCMNLVSKSDYQQQVEHAIQFIEGKNYSLLNTIQTKMETAAENQAYEIAAIYRDQIQTLRKVLEKQYITNSTGDADVIAIIQKADTTIIQVFYYRSGRNLGSQCYYPKVRMDDEIEDILQRFIEQIYFDKAPPKVLITNLKIPNQDLLNQFFKHQFNHKVDFIYKPKEHKDKWLSLCIQNAQLNLSEKLLSSNTLIKQFEALKQYLNLANMPKKIACVDVSHTQGSQTIASYVVFDQGGAKKSEYRKYPITNVTAGDDYAAIEQILTRRFKKILSTQKTDDSTLTLPDVLFIDGGIGQFNRAKQVLLDLNCFEQLKLVGVAKGADRKVGLERLITSNQTIKLKASDSAMHLIQKIRDESHRFAITGHRKKRQAESMVSELQRIEGIGNKKRQSLLKYFAGIKGVKEASINELAKVPGIGQNLATIIYDYFH